MFPGLFRRVFWYQGELRTFWSRPRHGRTSNEFEPCGFWGRENAIFARLHGAVYQSAVRSPRSLASRRRHDSSWHRRPLPLLRRLSSQRSTAAQSALSHASPLAHRAPASPSPPTLTNEPERSERSELKKYCVRFLPKFCRCVTFRVHRLSGASRNRILSPNRCVAVDSLS